MGITETLAALREKGFKTEQPYLQPEVGPLKGRMYVVVDGVAMTYRQAEALNRGKLTLAEIAAKNSTPRD